MRTLKKNLSLKNQKGSYHWVPLRGPYQWGHSMMFVPKKSFFGFLVTVYGKVGDGDKFSHETFVLLRPRFHAASHSNIEAKEFFS